MFDFQTVTINLGRGKYIYKPERTLNHMMLIYTRVVLMPEQCTIVKAYVQRFTSSTMLR